MDFSRGQYVIYGPVRIILTEDEIRGQYNPNSSIFVLGQYNPNRSIYNILTE
jgi:hypothetical protein